MVAKINDADIRAEQSVIGGLLLDNEKWWDVEKIIQARDFALPEHRSAYTAIGQKINEGQPADIITVGGVTGCEFSYLAEIAKNTPSSANAVFYAKSVQKAADERCFIKTIKEANQRIDGGADTDKVVGWVKEHLQPAKTKNLSSLKIVDLAGLMTAELPPKTGILSPWLLTSSLNMIYAWRGVGKTHASLGIAYAVASGGEFLKWSANEPSGVLFVDGEMPGHAIQHRLANIITASPTEPEPGALRIITPDLQDGAMPDLATPEGQQMVDAHIDEKTKLIVLDNLSSLVRRAGRENDAESWLCVSEWALQKRAQGKSILFIHHSGKGGQQRGTSKREDILDTVICLKKPNECTETGACFEVHFEKDRHKSGANPFEAKLVEDCDGVQRWALSEVETNRTEQIIEMFSELEMTQADIARELDINRSTVCRALKAANIDTQKKKPKKI